MDPAGFLKKSVDILSDLDDQQIDLLARNAEFLEFRENTTIIKRGDMSRYLWIVYEGEVEVSLLNEEDREEVVVSLERESLLGETTF